MEPTTLNHERGSMTMDREWLLCNGRGGFASGTIMGVPTRRYHGLLCVAARPPLERWMLLNAVLEKVSIRDECVELANFEFERMIHPRGYEHQIAFDYDLSPDGSWARFFFHWRGISITKQIVVRRGRDEVELHYDITAPPGPEIRLDIMPLVSMRDYHALLCGSRTMQRTLQGGGFLLRGSNPACPALQITGQQKQGDAVEQSATPLAFDASDDWWRNFSYRVERSRGQDCLEDLFAPGWFHARGHDEFHVALRARAILGLTEPAPTAEIPDPPRAAGHKPPSPADRLHDASWQFIVERRLAGGQHSHTILAGYPWFGDWGRDTFISLPGLLLLDKAYDEAKNVLCTFASAQKDGLIPNRFSDYGDGCDYNSVDASMWFINAADAYTQMSGDMDTWRKVLEPACRRVVDSFVAGTRYCIFVDADGMVSAGDPTTQLTWMDAKCGDVVFTPRHGKCVEINALWYHALCVLAERLPNERKIIELRDKVRANFAEVFWNPDRRCLYDCIRPEETDGRIRPNQIFAVSLPHSALPQERQTAVVHCVEQHLLTPYGLRTLSPGDPGYRGRYEGSQFERDSTYHQGTVWPWLIGGFVEAYLRAHDFHDEAKAHCRSLLNPLIAHLDDAGLGSVSEIFDGDAPHRPHGCFAQAWSVAEVRRALALTDSL